MSQKTSIISVRVEGAAPYLGECVDVDGNPVPTWSSDPDRVMRWLCDGWRCRYNQLRSRRKKWDRDKSQLVPLGDVVDERTDKTVREECTWLTAIPAMILQSPNRIENTDWWAAVKRRKTLKKKHRYPGSMPRFKKKRRDLMFACWHHKGANAVFTRFNRTHGEVVISGQNPKEHSQKGMGCRYRIHIRIRLSQPIREYTSICVNWTDRTLVFVNAPLPINRTRTGLETGADRGVKHNVALSDGRLLDLPKGRLEAIDKEIRRRQKAQARRISQSAYGAKDYVRGRQSKRYLREQERIGRLYRKAHDIIEDFQQQVTTMMVRDYDLIVLEDLNLTGMSRRAKPVPDPLRPGKYLPNGQAAKRGLNRALRGACMGGVKEKLDYKTKLAYACQLVLVNPAYTSQTCSRCGHTCRENRESQAVFHCKRCGLVMNADVNAAINILLLGRFKLSSTGIDVTGRDVTMQDVPVEYFDRHAIVSREPTAQHH